MRFPSKKDMIRGPHRPYVMAHRGAMGEAPENTMASFRRAAETGADSIELDVHLSLDGVPMVIHDATLERTTDGQGRVDAHPAEALRRLDAGSRFDPAFAGERIPTLQEVLEWAKGKLAVVIELKTEPGRDAMPAGLAVQGLVERLDAVDRVALISFDHVLLRDLKRGNPELRTALLYAGRLVDPVAAARAAGADGLFPHYAYLDAAAVEACHAAGLWIGAWNPNTVAELEHCLSLDLDTLGTNFPQRLRRLKQQA